MRFFPKKLFFEIFEKLFVNWWCVRFACVSFNCTSDIIVLYRQFSSFILFLFFSLSLGKCMQKLSIAKIAVRSKWLEFEMSSWQSENKSRRTCASYTHILSDTLTEHNFNQNKRHFVLYHEPYFVNMILVWKKCMKWFENMEVNKEMAEKNVQALIHRYNIDSQQPSNITHPTSQQ